MPEGAYDPVAPRGVDRFVKAVLDNGLARTGNLYAELGSTWRGLMTRPEQAAHVLGKLLRHVGEDRILWGTDCIWYGSPRDQLAAFRAFQIPAAMQEAHGYPALTPEIKRKILGLNAARVYGVDVAAMRCRIRDDDVARLRRQAAAEGVLPVPGRQYGPRTRREFLALTRRGGPG